MQTYLSRPARWLPAYLSAGRLGHPLPPSPLPYMVGGHVTDGRTRQTDGRPGSQAARQAIAGGRDARGGSAHPCLFLLQLTCCLLHECKQALLVLLATRSTAAYDIRRGSSNCKHAFGMWRRRGCTGGQWLQRASQASDRGLPTGDRRPRLLGPILSSPFCSYVRKHGSPGDSRDVVSTLRACRCACVR